MVKETSYLAYSFQYNYCFGGIIQAFVLNGAKADFNTTIVSVEFISKSRKRTPKFDFNTTIVSVEYEWKGAKCNTQI